jgi:hypothetical protein
MDTILKNDERWEIIADEIIDKCFVDDLVDFCGDNKILNKETIEKIARRVFRHTVDRLDLSNFDYSDYWIEAEYAKRREAEA